MSVFVTGGTGFLGKQLVKELAKQDKVHLLAREQSDLSGLEELANVKVFRGDLKDLDSVGAAMDSCETVFHLAALVSSWGPSWHHYSVNVKGFENVAKIALAQKVKKFVYCSSFLALGNSDKCVSKIGDEEKLHDRKFHNPYERTKYLGLCKASEFAENGLPIVTVLPGILYGAGELRESNYFGKWIESYKKGKTIVVPGKGDQLGCCSLIGDVVQGILLAWKKGVVKENYILGGENVSLNQFVSAMETVGGKKARVKHISFAVLKIGAWLSEKKGFFSGQKPELAQHEVEIFKHNWGYNSAKAEKELGYRITPLAKGLKKTI
ncbi:MAG: hypothetical protein CL943_00340 [Candidatus Diapherotrites archaeon]|uniref:NAD-dependent epimerase/dehydratase domain-containing protein n=1 Tax=Candidatus Iainarchaeum sp. TaxID=3101447 RepID=A0A2D6M014_9ARCH|nr:hypothetical protein [Candidatus Diapherotrites archaeon]|tara:strand:- start:2153 stop:3121 length:969 start_codon:yes stop_codon:yes gene_type:complete